jgi:hypothetical protein
MCPRFNSREWKFLRDEICTVCLVGKLSYSCLWENPWKDLWDHAWNFIHTVLLALAPLLWFFLHCHEFPSHLRYSAAATDFDTCAAYWIAGEPRAEVIAQVNRFFLKFCYVICNKKRKGKWCSLDTFVAVVMSAARPGHELKSRKTPSLVEYIEEVQITIGTFLVGLVITFTTKVPLSSFWWYSRRKVNRNRYLYTDRSVVLSWVSTSHQYFITGAKTEHISCCSPMHLRWRPHFIRQRRVGKRCWLIRFL